MTATSRWLWLIPLLLVVAVYWPAPGGERVWDDTTIIDKQLPAFTTVTDALWPRADIPQFGGAYYRPVVTLSFMLDRAVYGDALVAGLHVSNILFHGLVTLLVLLLTRRLLRDRSGGSLGALVAGCVFAVHPIHTESVNWISGRTDVLAALLVLASLLAGLRWRDRGNTWALVLCVVAYFLGTLAKEVAVATLALLPLILWLAPPEALATGKRRTGASLWLPLAFGLGLATLGYFALRAASGVNFGASTEAAFADQVSHLLRALGYYTLKVVFPWPQSHFVVWSMTPGLLWGGLVTAAGCLALGLADRAQRRGDSAVPLLALLWFGITLAPSLAIAMRAISETPVAERYLYLPSVALCLAIGAAVAAAWTRDSWRWPSAATVGLLLVAFGGLTVARGFVWRDEIRLWTDATRNAPDEGLPWLELGMAYSNKERTDEAAAAWTRALNATGTDPENIAFASNNLGMVALDRQDLADAERLFRQALSAMPGYATPHFGLGQVFENRAAALLAAGSTPAARSGLLASAEAEYREAVRLDPGYFKAQFHLARILARQGGEAEGAGDRSGAARFYGAALAQLEVVAGLREAATSDPPLPQLQAGLANRLVALGYPPGPSGR